MMKVFITRKIPDAAVKILRENGHDVIVSSKDRPLTKKELIRALEDQNYNAVLCLLTDKIDVDIFDAAGKQCKIFANYAVGYDNINLQAAEERGIIITNTPEVLTESVAEHAIALIFAISRRIVEADQFMRDGKFIGWSPLLFLGNNLIGKTLGLIGIGRIGAAVAKRMHDGFEMKIIYHDVKRNEELEGKYHLRYVDLETLLKESDIVSIHVPLLPTTRHLISEEQLGMMKKTAYLVNTSRGPVIDEAALVDALKNGRIKGAALDVYENEPEMAPGLAKLQNTVLTPHTASATEETRNAMAELAAKNIIAVLGGKEPLTPVKY